MQPTQRVAPDLGNGFTEIISPTWHWMCNLSVSNGSEISWPCIISAAAEIGGMLFFLFFFLLRGRLNCWYTVHTNTDKALHAIGFQGHCCFYGGLSILYCLLAFPWLSEHTRSIYDEKQGTLYSNHAIAHRSNGCSNNYNLRIMNLAYTRWFLFW